MSEKTEQAKNHERIGREIELVVAQGYANKKRLIFVSLLKGVFTGIGSVIGATLVFVLIIWTLSLFSEIPLIGDLFENVQKTIEEVPGK